MMTRDQATKAVLLIGLLHATAARATWSIALEQAERQAERAG